MPFLCYLFAICQTTRQKREPDGREADELRILCRPGSFWELWPVFCCQSCARCALRSRSERRTVKRKAPEKDRRSCADLGVTSRAGEQEPGRTYTTSGALKPSRRAGRDPERSPERLEQGTGEPGELHRWTPASILSSVWLPDAGGKGRSKARVLPFPPAAPFPLFARPEREKKNFFRGRGRRFS